MYKNVKQGWYKVKNKDKVIKPLDGYMNSYMVENNEVFLQYKSSLELKAFRYADANPHITKFAIEPFHIKYIKPTDGKIHRYFIDLFLEFKTGDKFIIEIKSSNETKPPQIPKRKTQKAVLNYQKALQTYAINSSKWSAAKEFAILNNMRFIILTEEQLGN